MIPQSSHYRETIRNKTGTRLGHCGYLDRFDPYRLNASEHVKSIYTGLLSAVWRQTTFERLLDVGCGTGVYFDALAAYAGTIDALDISEDMAAVAHEYCLRTGHSSIRVGVADAERLPFDDATFDAAIAFDVLHHARHPDALLDEVSRVLRPGAELLVFEPNLLNPLMLLAHLFPAEERGAWRTSRPGPLKRLLGAHFRLKEWKGVCATITLAGGLQQALMDADVLVCRLLGNERIYPRQICVARKEPI